MKEITPYLSFDGNCREAMEFYHRVLGGELSVMSFADAPMETTPESKDRVMHARLQRGSTVLMASDTMPGMSYQQGNHVSMNIYCETDEEVDALYAALGEGGTGTMPPSETFWKAYFAMVTDRFGFEWLLNHEHAPQG